MRNYGFLNLYSWNAHSVYVFSLETFCKFGSMGGTTKFGPEESSTKFRSTGQFHNLGQLNVDFRLLWAGKLVAQIKYVFEILGSALITLVMALESS